MSQTSYAVLMTAAFLGAHGQLIECITGRNNSGAEIPYGRAVAHDLGAGTSDLAVKLPAAATDKIRGVALYDASHEPETTGIGDDKILSIVKQGCVRMLTEENVGPSDPVYVRHTTGGAGEAKGQVRKSPDGAAEVNTITPTAANATVYSLSFRIGSEVFNFQVVSDADGTAAEIVTAFKAAMAANAAFTALVVATGTATLILTSQSVGVPQNIQTNGPGVLAIAATTPAAPEAVLMSDWSFESSGTAAGGVWVNVKA